MASARLLFDPQKAGRRMRVAAFMSGSGTNIRRLLERGSPHLEVAFIFSDRMDEHCKGPQIARQYGLPFFAHDIRSFHRLNQLKRTVTTPEGLAARRRFDQVAARLVEAFAVDIIALGGYMSFLTLDTGVNVHPADLSLVDEDGRRTFVGDNAVYDAIWAGQSQLRASTLWIDQGVDSGPLMMVSDPIAVELPAPLGELKQEPARLMDIANQHQERLKEAGDWVVFPLTLELIAQGRLGLDEDNVVTLDGQPRPGGVRPGDL